MASEQASGVPRAPFVVALVAALLGCGLAAELTRLHFRLNENPDLSSFCNVSARVNCDAVARSSYASVFGVPVALWGLLAYTVIAGVSLWGLRSRTHRPILPLFVLCTLCGVASVILSLISSLAVKSLCLLCAASWVVDLVLFGAALGLARKGRLAQSLEELRVALEREPAWGLVVGFGGIVVVGVTLAVTPHAETRAQALPDPSVSPRAAASGKAMSNRNLPSGIDGQGNHYLGATQPRLTITEFSDYQCPFCSRGHARLRALVEKYPEDIRLVHRHYPLDADCNATLERTVHPYACHYARLAICAGELGKFWDVNDYLFEHGHDPKRVTVDALSEDLGLEKSEIEVCMKERASASLRVDVEAGVALKIEGTPTLVVDGKSYPGNLPKEILAPYPMP
jgi:protein-disulfide isomerase/uncharacterized membrane protein